MVSRVDGATADHAAETGNAATAPKPGVTADQMAAIAAGLAVTAVAGETTDQAADTAAGAVVIRTVGVGAVHVAATGDTATATALAALRKN